MNDRFIKKEIDGKAYIELSGAFKTSDAELFGEMLMQVVSNNTRTVIDMEKTEYICSGILREMLACQAFIDEQGGKEMTITNANDEIMEVFEMTGFNNIISIE